MQHGGSVNRTITYRTCITGLHLLNTPFLSPDLLDASLAPPPVTLSDFHFVGVSGPLQSVRRPQDMIYYLKAVTNSFCIFCEFILSWELWKIVLHSLQLRNNFCYTFIFILLRFPLNSVSCKILVGTNNDIPFARFFCWCKNSSVCWVLMTLVTSEARNVSYVIDS